MANSQLSDAAIAALEDAIARNEIQPDTTDPRPIDIPGNTAPAGNVPGSLADIISNRPDVSADLTMPARLAAAKRKK